jgi:hypothetical protein
VPLSSGFFDLNLRFAHKVAEVSGIPFEGALLQHTHCYVRFTNLRDFAQDNPVWQAYLAGLRDVDPLEWTYTFYVEQDAHAPSRLRGPQFGCFSYSRLADGRMRLHFHNAERGDEHPLGDDRLAQRRAELAALFAHVREHAPDATRVAGGSWLYNLEAYRRLFPRAFLASARPGEGDFQFMTLWGQFLDRHGEVRPGPAAQFLERLERAKTLAEAAESFPLKVLYLEAKVEGFQPCY